MAANEIGSYNNSVVVGTVIGNSYYDFEAVSFFVGDMSTGSGSYGCIKLDNLKDVGMDVVVMDQAEFPIMISTAKRIK